MGKHLQVGGTPTTGQVPTYNGSSTTWASPSGGGGSSLTVAPTNLTSGGGAVTTSAVTASVTPTANALILLSVSARNGNSIDPTTPTVSGNGLTWVLVNSITSDNTSTSRRMNFLFRAMGSAPTSGAITITFGETETDASWSVDQFTNVVQTGTNGSGAVIQNVAANDLTGAATSLTVTLAAFAASTNATFGFFGTDGAAGATAGTGLTALGHGNSGTNVTTDTEFKSSSTTSVAMSFGVVAGIGGIAVEIAAASSVPITKLTTTGSGAASLTGDTLNVPTPAAAPVTSVAGKTGVVTLVEADIANLTTDLAAKQNTITTLPIANGGTGAATLPTGILKGAGTGTITAVTAPAGAVVGTTDTQTFTNKRITKRVITATSSATPTPTGDTADIWYLSTLTVGATFAAPTGTPTDGQQLTIRIKSVAAQTLAWNAIYLSSGVATLPTTSVAGKTIVCAFQYDTAAVKWVLLAVDPVGY